MGSRISLRVQATQGTTTLPRSDLGFRTKDFGLHYDMV